MAETPPPPPATTAVPPGARAGRAMLTLGWIGALALLTWFFAGREAAHINPNQELASSIKGGVAEVLLQQNRDGHYVANGTINGQPVTFMLDTGATDVAIPAELAAQLRLPNGRRGEAQTANGVVPVIGTRIDELTLGALTLHDVRASISSRDQGEFILLGMSALRDVEMTQRGRTLLLRAQAVTP